MSRFQKRKRDFFSHFGFGNGTASVLIFYFPLPFPRFGLFFPEMEMEPVDLHRSFIFRQTKFGQNQFFDFSFHAETKSNIFIQSMATLQLFFIWFEQAEPLLISLFVLETGQFNSSLGPCRFRFWKRDKEGPKNKLRQQDIIFSYHSSHFHLFAPCFTSTPLQAV